jgi:hypothetical protein
MFQYDESAAMGINEGSNRINKGGYYKGTITGCKITEKGSGQTCELEVTTATGETTGKMFLVLKKKTGETVDKNGKPLLGRGILSAIMAFNRVQNLTNGQELITKPIGVYGKMVNSYSDTDYKYYYNFSLLNVMDPATNQTFAEKKENKPAARYLVPVTDEQPKTAEQSPDGPGAHAAGNATPADSGLPF